MSILERLAVFMTDHLNLGNQIQYKIYLFVIKHFLNGEILFVDNSSNCTVWVWSTKNGKHYGVNISENTKDGFEKEKAPEIIDRIVSEVEIFKYLKFE